MIRVGSLSINPAFVVSMSWDRRHYMNGPGDSYLLVRMHDGHEHRIKHEPHYLNGVDAYRVEREIAEALARPAHTED